MDDPLWKQQWDEDALALTIYKGDQFVSTENVTTMANKVRKTFSIGFKLKKNFFRWILRL